MDQNNLETQWTAYAMNNVSSKNHRSNLHPLVTTGMLAATGAAVFSLPSQASASIIFTGVNQTVTWNNTGAAPGSALATVNLPFSPAVKFEGYFVSNTVLGNGQVGNGNVGGVKAFGGSLITHAGVHASNAVNKLAFGAAITAGANFKSVSNVPMIPGAPLNIKSGADLLGTFPNNVSYFAGFKMSNGDLGYIQLEVLNDGTNSPYPDELKIVGYGYNTTPGAAITAGELPPAPPVPEASNTATALLLLACAGGSLVSWRKRKLAAA